MLKDRCLENAIDSENIKISIIIPVYKGEQYLSECLNSTLNQTMKDIEVIIVDKAENDNARAIIDYYEKLDSRIKAPHVKNNGEGASCNIGLDIAKGKYIMIVEADDFIEPDACEKVYEYAESLGADVVKTPYYDFFDDGYFQDCAQRKLFSETLPKNKCFSVKEYGIILAYHASIWSCLYKRDYLKQNNIRFVEANGAGYIDVNFRIDTITNTDRIAWLDFPFYNYRIDSMGSSTNSWNTSVMNQRWREAHEKFVERQEDYDAFYGPYLIADEYTNTLYRNHISPLTDDDFRDIMYNLSYVDSKVIEMSPVLTEAQKAELLQLKKKTPKDIRTPRQKVDETAGLPVVKIVVSHHNEEHVTVDNPIYYHMLSGSALYEKEIHLLRDDSGENISNKNRSYCELTAQYWAWKNLEADYYGLCHYRRYIDFSGNQWTQLDDHGEVVEKEPLNKEIAKKYGLLDDVSIRKFVSKYDAILIASTDVNKMPTMRGFQNTIYDFWERGAINLLEPGTVDRILELIKDRHPQYYPAAIEYMKQGQHRGYNTFILSKKLFNMLCEFEFDILFTIEKELHPDTHSALMYRMMGYFAEILSAIFYYYIEHYTDSRCAIRQLIYFENCKKPSRSMLKPAFDRDNIAIVFVCSQQYVPFLGVSLQSLKQTMSEKNNYDIIVLETEINNISKEKINSIFRDKANVKVRFYDPYNMVRQHNFKINIQNYNVLPFYKALLAWILPLHSKVIVLDTDIIVQKDVAAILDVDWGEKYVAAVKDSVVMGLVNGFEAGWREHLTEVLELDNPYDYINAGVLAMDLDKIRRNMIAEKIVAIAKRTDLRIDDQDVINVAYKNNIHFLDCRWNYFVKTNWWVSGGIEHSPRAVRNEYESAKNDPFILHYANQPKPWAEFSVPYSENWWSVARNSLFYEMLLQQYIVSSPNHCVTLTEPVMVDQRSVARKIADVIIPKGTRRREIAKKILPKKGTRGWEFLKKIYYFIFRG